MNDYWLGAIAVCLVFIATAVLWIAVNIEHIEKAAK